MKIEMRTVPHTEQRYPTVGDYWWEGPPFGAGSKLTIVVSDFDWTSEQDNWKMAALVAFHEMFEALATASRGLAEPDIVAFDVDWESRRDDVTGEHPSGYSEPGADPRAPYHVEHTMAEVVERTLAVQLGVDWAQYENAVEEMP